MSKKQVIGVNHEISTRKDVENPSDGRIPDASSKCKGDKKYADADTDADNSSATTNRCCGSRLAIIAVVLTILVIYLASGSTTFDGAAKNRNGLDNEDDTIDAVEKPSGDEVDNIKVVEVEKEMEEKKDDKEAKDETTDAVKAEMTEKSEKGKKSDEKKKKED
jgi:hypothetical protein